MSVKLYEKMPLIGPLNSWNLLTRNTGGEIVFGGFSSSLVTDHFLVQVVFLACLGKLLSWLFGSTNGGQKKTGENKFLKSYRGCLFCWHFVPYIFDVFLLCNFVIHLCFLTLGVFVFLLFGCCVSLFISISVFIFYVHSVVCLPWIHPFLPKKQIKSQRALIFSNVLFDFCFYLFTSMLTPHNNLALSNWKQGKRNKTKEKNKTNIKKCVALWSASSGRGLPSWSMFLLYRVAYDLPTCFVFVVWCCPFFFISLTF